MRSSAFLTLLLAAAAGGCLSGQTGSPDCVGPVSCVCDPLYGGGALLKVHAESAEGGQLVAVVDEALAGLYGATTVTAGERVGGSIIAERPCTGRESPSPTVAGGDYLVVYFPGSSDGYPNCSAFEGCAAERCNKLSEPELIACWDACDAETAEACAARRAEDLLNGAFSIVVPWEEELDFGKNHRLPVADWAVLSSPQSCLERFPADPAPPCNDVVTYGACSVPDSTPASSAPSAFAVGALLAAAGLVRRRTRRRSAAHTTNGITARDSEE